MLICAGVGELGQQGTRGRARVLRRGRGHPPRWQVAAQRRDVQLVLLLGRDRPGHDRHPEVVADQVEQGVHVVHLELDPVRQPGGGEGPVGQYPRRPVGLEADEGEAVQRRQVHLLLPGQVVVRVAQHDQGLSRQRDQVHSPRGRPGHRDQGHVEPARRELVDQQGGAAEAQPDLHPRMGGPEPGQLGRQVHHPQALLAAHAQRAAQHAAHGGHRVLRRGHAGQGAVRLGEQHPSRLGQLDPPGAAHEQRRAQLGFQRPDRRGQAGLGDLQQFGRVGEVAFLGHRDEVLQLAQFHDYAILEHKAIGSSCWTDERLPPSIEA